MTVTLVQLKNRIENWATQSNQDGVVTISTLETIRNLSTETPASLFEVGERPLVVGLFGGTGVGKSTLLNRFAGESIARTSVERPTSREVTLYLHNSVQLSHLPKNFPVEKILSSTHNRAEHRHLLWIDMPDYDSVEEKNRVLVENWLPHIDVLLYVVSPERYKDDNGWRLLLTHGNRHAWVFVMNHWDRGHELQRKDFEAMLQGAGLDNPLLFCTDCSEQSANTKPSTDDFDSLEASIQSMADNNTIQQLESRGLSVRTDEMRTVVNQVMSSMGDETGFASLELFWKDQWRAESPKIRDALNWKFPVLAKPFANPESGFFSSLIGTLRGKSDVVEDTTGGSTTQLINTPIFDPESIDRIADDLDELAQQANEYGLAPALIRNQLAKVKPDLATTLNRIATQSIKESVAKPGTPFQRVCYSAFGVLSTILPVAAMIWAGYRIVDAFYRGGSEPGSYLGSNFAVNGLLLIGLAWILPFFLRRKTRPSVEKAAIRGMESGTKAALAHIDSEVREQLVKAAGIQQAHIESAAKLFDGTGYISHDVPENLSRVIKRSGEPV